MSARDYENAEMWYEAAQSWKAIGRKLDSDACMMIYEAIDKGNRFRRLTKIYNVQYAYNLVYK